MTTAITAPNVTAVVSIIDAASALSPRPMACATCRTTAEDKPKSTSLETDTDASTMDQTPISATPSVRYIKRYKMKNAAPVMVTCSRVAVTLRETIVDAIDPCLTREIIDAPPRAFRTFPLSPRCCLWLHGTNYL